jgi:RpiR family carbohydrate utilization transcriptional regulator
MLKHQEQQTRRSGPNILEVVRLSFASLRKSERKVAELVLASPHKVFAATVAEVADAAGVSQPTVIRFCVALGCSGFQDFRLRLAQSVALGTPATHSVIGRDDSPMNVVEKIFEYTITSLDWARHHLDPVALEAAIQVLEMARSITFFGFGASAIVAADAQQKFPLFGVPCIAHLDSHQQIMSAAMMGPGDVAVAISNTGLSQGIIEAARLAKQNGAATIALTGTRACLSDCCDVTLLAETLDNTDLFTPTTSRIAALVLIDVLSTAVALRRSGAHRDRIREMKQTLLEFRQRDPPPREDDSAS